MSDHGRRTGVDANVDTDCNHPRAEFTLEELVKLGVEYDQSVYELALTLR
eukprot:GABW01005086.1.p1 GENE.GABW01005086.1~~GABW01005086.1.p1  ORF type:complete len:50 (-),score=2.53 GABW01005086.1:64-213(-)